MENKQLSKISTRVKRGTVTARPGDLVVSCAQPASTLMAIALEPTSMWGLLQYEEFSALRVKGGDYPVYRIMK
jgi:hypothetical protein